MRRLSRISVRAAILSVLLFLGAVAPAAADGLSRFEQDLKPAMVKETDLVYGSAAALGQSGFVLNDVRMTIKDDSPGSTPTPVQIRRVTVEDMDFDNAKGADGPHYLKLRAEGFKVTGEAEEWLKRYGLADGAADFALDYRLDAARKVFTLNKLEVTLPGLARFELGLIMDDVSPSAVAAKPDAAMDEGSLRTATLIYEDSSLLAKVIPSLAAEEKKPVDVYLNELLEVVAILADGQGPRTLPVYDALVSFIRDYSGPKGPLRITVSPPANVSAKDMDKLTVTNAIVDVFGLSASYAGTRAGAALEAKPKAAPAARQPQSAAVPQAGGIACTAGQRLFALSDGGWWSATVREPTQSGSRCVVRIEGEDEDTIVAREGMIAWSLDGPGKLAGACKKGDKVLMKSEGAWYPADVKQAKGRSCVVVMEDDDEEHTVELRRLRVLAR